MSCTSKDKHDFTKGSMAGSIVRLSLPMILAQLVNVLYNIVDRMYLGHMPGDSRLALTGVGVAFPIITIINAFANLCGSGGAPWCSIERGRGDEKKGRADHGQFADAPTDIRYLSDIYRLSHQNASFVSVWSQQ